MAVAVFLFCCVSLRAQTLRDFLVQHKIPTTSLPGAALAQTVEPGPIAQSDRWVVASWSLPGASANGWPLHHVRLDRQSGATRVGEVALKADDLCSGSLVDIQLVGEFMLLATHINPSAECLLVVGPTLRLRRTLYGFEPREVEPGRIVIIENMVHFAAVHPERLQLVDLATGEIKELYPPKDDALRARMAQRNAAGMPSHEVCADNNDPCDPAMFDETISDLATDGRGRFAIVVDDEADHVTASGQNRTVAAQSVLYVYQHAAAGWAWCETPLTEPPKNLSPDAVAGRCQPTQPVVPDMKGAEMNPFAHP